jgi:ATP-dependent protease ClpP protease subunit
MTNMFFLLFLLFNFNLFSKSFHFNKKITATLIGFTLFSPLQLIPNSIYSNSIVPYANAAPMSIYDTTFVQTTNNNIYFFGSLDKESSKALKDALYEVINNSLLFENQFKVKSPPINLHIQSEGGSLLHSMYLVDIIKNSPIPIHTYIDGFAASAATLISVSGHKRFMTENSLMLIHQLSSSSSGKYNELNDDMDNFKTFMDLIKKIYFKNTRISSEELNDLLKHDLWLNSQKCLQLGLVDEITK